MKTKRFYLRPFALINLLISFILPTSAQFANSPEMKKLTQPTISTYSGGIQLIRKHFNQHKNCYAFAPADWEITGSRREGDALDIYSADRSMYAGYLILGVNGGLATGYYSRIYATPETFINYNISENGSKTVFYGHPFRDSLGYTMLPFEIEGTPSVKGVVFYRVWSIPGDPYGYIIVMRNAKTLKHLWTNLGAQAISVSLSIRSIVQIRADGNNNSKNSDDKRVESSYNMQLGMEYAHDPDTGENYWVNPSKDYNETGKDGPGYYKNIGNDTKKLMTGRSDD